MNNTNNNSESLLLQNRLDCMISDLQGGLIKDLNWLLKRSNDHNAIIHIGESPNVKSFKVHTSILSARSLYFRAILSNSHFVSNNSLIEITQTNIKPDTFYVILKFLYTGIISLENEKNVENLFEYIIAAKNLWLNQLIHYIENFLLIEMHDWLISNFVYVLTTIKLHTSSFKLLHNFVNDILKNNPNLLYNSNNFCNLPEPILIDLLQNREFPSIISEEKIWDVILNWGIKQNIDLFGKDICDWTNLDFSKLQTSLQRCIPLIRFTDIPPDVFFDKIDPYKPIFTSRIYDRIMQSPTFVMHRNLMSRPSSPSSLSPSTLYKSAQQHFKNSPIITEILQKFPRPPSQTSSVIIEPSKDKHLSRPKSKYKSKPLPEIASSDTAKSKYLIKRTLSFKKSGEQKNASSTSYAVRRSTSIYSIETLDDLSTTKARLKKNISSNPSVSSTEESEFTISRPIVELTNFKSFGESHTCPLIIRKAKGSLNRKTSIISSRPSTPLSSTSIF